MLVRELVAILATHNQDAEVRLEGEVYNHNVAEVKTGHDGDGDYVIIARFPRRNLSLSKCPQDGCTVNTIRSRIADIVDKHPAVSDYWPRIQTLLAEFDWSEEDYWRVFGIQ